jgi:glycosyltransferase involved in cell wall biosynthesis
MTVTATPQRRRWPLVERYFDRRVEQSCQFVISNCDYLTKMMRDLRDFSESKALTIYGGVPRLPPPSQDAVNTLCRKWSISRPLVGSVAVLQYHKGHRFLLEAILDLKRDFPSLCCLLIGDGAERDKLQEMVSGLDLSQQVRFAGHMKDFRTAIEAMDIFVHPSLEEGFPYVILEAMALGKPIVATRIAGVPEQIIHGQSGLLVEPGKADELSKAIRELLADPQRAQELGKNAKERANLFTTDQMTKKFLQLY